MIVSPRSRRVPIPNGHFHGLETGVILTSYLDDPQLVMKHWRFRANFATMFQLWQSKTATAGMDGAGHLERKCKTSQQTKRAKNIEESEMSHQVAGWISNACVFKLFCATSLLSFWWYMFELLLCTCMHQVLSQQSSECVDAWMDIISSCWQVYVYIQEFSHIYCMLTTIVSWEEIKFFCLCLN